MRALERDPAYGFRCEIRMAHLEDPFGFYRNVLREWLAEEGSEQSDESPKAQDHQSGYCNDDNDQPRKLPVQSLQTFRRY